MGLFDKIFDGGHDSIVGNIGGKGQKISDPLAWIPGFGDKYVDFISNKIPSWGNSAISTVMQPFEAVDKTVNPVRKIPFLDKIGDAVADRPVDAAALAVGSYFGGAAALGGAAGAGAGAGGAGALGAEGAAAGAGGGSGLFGFGAGGSAGGFSGLSGGLSGIFGGGGGAGIGGMGATGGAGAFGGGVSSSVLPGIFGGGTVAPEIGGASMFGGSLGTGSITGTSAPLFADSGLLSSGGGGLFGGNGMSTMQKGQLLQNAMNSGGKAAGVGQQPQQTVDGFQPYQDPIATLIAPMPAQSQQQRALSIGQALLNGGR